MNLPCRREQPSARGPDLMHEVWADEQRVVLLELHRAHAATRPTEAGSAAASLDHKHFLARVPMDGRAGARRKRLQPDLNPAQPVVMCTRYRDVSQTLSAVIVLVQLAHVVRHRAGRACGHHPGAQSLHRRRRQADAGGRMP